MEKSHLLISAAVFVGAATPLLLCLPTDRKQLFAHKSTNFSWTLQNKYRLLAAAAAGFHHGSNPATSSSLLSPTAVEE